MQLLLTPCEARLDQTKILLFMMRVMRSAIFLPNFGSEVTGAAASAAALSAVEAKLMLMLLACVADIFPQQENISHRA